MAREFETLEDLLRFVDAEGIGLTHAQGYDWFWRKFQPALSACVTDKSIEREVISSCHYVAGDVHEFNRAPRAAIDCYQKALKVEPTLGSAHREIADMYCRMGDMDNARIHSDRALTLIPSDKHTIADRVEIDEAVADEYYEPFYQSDDSVWPAFELLAQRNPGKALEILKEEDGDDSRRARICCYGAMRQADKYLAVWEEVIKQSDAIEFEYFDWFFMPESVFGEPDIWRMLFECKADFSGVFTVFDGLDSNSIYNDMTTHEKIRLRLEYCVYAQSLDRVGLRRLHEQFPEWLELAETVRG